MTILFRFFRRRTTWETSDPEEVLEVEFRKKDGAPDLNPSVYLVPDSPVLIHQAYTEHCAASSLNPPRGSTGADLSDLPGGMPRATSGLPAFAFIQSAHRELCFACRRDLLGAITRVLAEQGRRRRDLEARKMRMYVHQRLEDGDPEWRHFVNVSAKGRKWQEWAEGA